MSDSMFLAWTFVMLIVGGIFGAILEAQLVLPNIQSSRLCPHPYDTILTKDGQICRMPAQPKTEYFIMAQDGSMVINCTERAQVTVRDATITWG